MSNKTQTQKSSTKEEVKLFADTNISMKSGRLTRDAEVVADGKFTKIRIANNKEYLDENGEKQVTTSYFNALVSKNLKDAFETAKDLKKGDWVYMKGNDRTTTFDTVEGFSQTASTLYPYKVVHRKSKVTENSPKAEVS